MNKRQYKLRRRIQGLTLVEVMVAASIGAIVLYFVIDSITLGMKGAKKVAKKTDTELTRQVIHDIIDCNRTLNPANNSNIAQTMPRTCTGEIKLYRKGPKSQADQEIGPDGKIGQWKLQANCTSIGIEVKGALLSPDGTCCAKDPLTNLPMDFNAPEGQFFTKGQELCQSYFIEDNLWVDVTPEVDTSVNGCYCLHLDNSCSGTGIHYTNGISDAYCVPVSGLILTPLNDFSRHSIMKIPPESICQKYGYATAGTSCKIDVPSTGVEGLGSIMSNNYIMIGSTRRWATSCQIGNGIHIVPKRILCY